MVDGFYALYYTGKVSSGFALLAIMHGFISGVDAGGGVYEGDYTTDQENHLFKATLRLIIPAGMPLVTGAPASPTAYTVPIALSLPLDFSHSQQPILVRTPIGPVNLNIKKLREIPPVQ
jgi:hypothetical protein